MEFVRAEGASMSLIVFEYAVIHAKFSAPANQVSDFPHRGNQRDQDDYPVYQDLGWICLR